MAEACNARQMGLGPLRDLDLRFKRKFRWTFRIEDVCANGKAGEGIIPEFFVKLASRPNLTIDEVEINFLNGKTWIPGKASWETITVTYYDVATASGAQIRALWDWLASVYNFTNNVCLQMGSNRRAYAGKAVLSLWDGCGAELERWTLNDVWPQAINFGDLDYSASEEVNIELTLRYSDVKYEPICPAFTINPCCDPCAEGINQQGAATTDATNFGFSP